jgi:dolichol-phosphate mannosyltransferase
MSRMGTLLAAPLAPLSDPMSGFFALRRASWEQAERLNPVGYKIGLELYVKGRCRRPAEVPIAFAERAAGQSKYGIREMLRFLRHLLRLYRFRFPVGAWCFLVSLTLAIVLTAALTLRSAFP